MRQTQYTKVLFLFQPQYYFQLFIGFEISVRLKSLKRTVRNAGMDIRSKTDIFCDHDFHSFSDIHAFSQTVKQAKNNPIPRQKNNIDFINYISG
jgi:hypothetical protein